MRALFFKELREGRSVVFFAIALAVLALACYFLLISPYALLVVRRSSVRLVFSFVVLMLPVLFALLAGAGIFASEKDRETLSMLLALPLSRKKIWLAEALAGLTLALVATILLLVVDHKLLCGAAMKPWRFLSLYLPDVALWILFVFSVTLFCSSITRSLMAAIAATVLLTTALIAGAFSLWHYLGAPLLGFPVELDIALWCGLTAPAFLLASLFVIMRGQLLQSAWNWALSFPLLIVMVLFMILAVSAAVRTTSNYQRSEIRYIETLGSIKHAKVATFVVAGKPLHFLEERNWLWNLITSGQFGKTKPEIPTEMMSSAANYCSYAIALDLASSKEIMTQLRPLAGSTMETPFEMAVSADGRYAAVLAQPRGLTWGVLPWAKPELRILDLAQSKLLYRGFPETLILGFDPHAELEWSPKSTYLAYGLASGPYKAGPSFLLKNDGTPLGPLPMNFISHAWSPTTEDLFGITKGGKLYRVPAGGGKPELIYLTEAQGLDQRILELSDILTDYNTWFSISPDGNWLALVENYSIGDPQRGKLHNSSVCIMRTDGAEPRVIWRESIPKLTSAYIRVLDWASDGRTCYWLNVRGPMEDIHLHPFNQHRLYAYTIGDKAARTIGPEINANGFTAFLIPSQRQDRLLIQAYEPDPKQATKIRPRTLLLVTPSGETRNIALPGASEKFGWPYFIIGVEAQGRVLLLPKDRSSIEVWDVDTGKLTRLYP